MDDKGTDACVVIPLVSGDVELDSSLLLETRNWSGNMFVNDDPATVHVLPLCPPTDGACTPGIDG